MKISKRKMSCLGHEGIIYGIQQNRMYVICDLCGHLPKFPPGSE